MLKKVHILVDLVDVPTGGGNQFLQALRDELRKRGLYAETADDAGIILFNSFPFGQLEKIVELARYAAARKVIIHRLDGPISIVRGRDRVFDRLIHKINELFADGTIFQTVWSRQKCYDLGLQKTRYSAVIKNAPNEQIFYPRQSFVLVPGEKIHLIASSWSSNLRKGFDVFKYLDENLDFSRFTFTFVGNSPVSFKNITHIPAVRSAELATLLRQKHIYIAASGNDPCSNALLEAMHCGLWILARKSGGHPELVGEAGVFFDGSNNVLERLESLVERARLVSPPPAAPSRAEVVSQYVDFLSQVESNRKVKRTGLGVWISLKMILFTARVWDGWTYLEQGLRKRFG